MYLPPLIAIDFGSYAIRVLEMSMGTKRSPPKIKRIAMKTIPEGTIQAGRIQVPDIVVRILADLIKKMGIRWLFMRRAAIYLGPEACIIKNTEITLSEGQDLEETVYASAEQELQTDITDLYFDFYERPTAFETNKRSVVLVAARKELVDQRIAILQQVNLKPGVVDCSAFVLSNAVESLMEPVNRTVAIVNVGKSTSEIIFMVNHQFYFSRAIGVGGDNFTIAMAEATGKSFAECEATKIRFSRENKPFDEKMSVALASAYAAFAHEIQQASDLFFQSKVAPIDSKDIEKVFVCGGGSQILGFSYNLRNHLKVTVEDLNPFERMGLKESSAFGNEFAPGYGLCLREYVAG